MSYAAAIAIVLVSALAAALMTVAVQHRVPIHVRRHHHDVGSVVFLQIGVVFAVLLAFVFSDTWDQYDAAAQAIHLEVADLDGVATLASALPPEIAERILTIEQGYVESVIFQEWPAMARTRGAYVQTYRRLQFLATSLAKLSLADPAQTATKAQIESLVAAARAQREIRIFQASSGIPLALWVVLIGITLLLSASVSFGGIEYRSTAAVLSAGFAATIVSILVLARLLDYPFGGALALSPHDFVGLLGQISTLMAGMEQPAG